jgi:hypothetical protein
MRPKLYRDPTHINISIERWVLIELDKRKDRAKLSRGQYIKRLLEQEGPIPNQDLNER